MIIIPVESGPIATIGYFVFNESVAEAIVIDVPMESSDRFLELQEIHSKKIKKIILTHSHWDHTADANELRNKTNAEILIHYADEYRLLSPMLNLPFPLPFELTPFKADKYINDGDTIALDDLNFQVLHTPGHTEGGICLVEINNKVAFVGDTLFFKSIGRTDLEGGSSYELLKSIKEKLLLLPDDFIIYSGHGPSTTIGYEKRYNYFL